MSSITNAHDLQHWLERHAEIDGSQIRADLGRGPRIGSKPGSTWISFESSTAFARFVLGPDGASQLRAMTRADSIQRVDERRLVTTRTDLDRALDLLVSHLA